MFRKASQQLANNDNETVREVGAWTAGMPSAPKSGRSVAIGVSPKVWPNLSPSKGHSEQVRPWIYRPPFVGKRISQEEKQ